MAINISTDPKLIVPIIVSGLNKYLSNLDYKDNIVLVDLDNLGSTLVKK